MNPLARIIKGVEGRASLTEPGELFSSAFAGGLTKSGQSVSIRGSLSLVPVYSATTMISSAVGAMPLIVYKRGDGGKERAPSHRAWSLLHDTPNPEMSADEVWEIVTLHLLLWGNAFVWKRRDSLGVVRQLWPMSPSRFQVHRDKAGRRLFVCDGNIDSPVTEADILHIRGPSLDGLVGMSPIQEARENLGVMKAQQEFQGQFLRNEGRPSVILKHPNKVSKDAAKRLEESFSASRPGGTKLIEEGIEVERWTMPMEDAQFLESMHLSDLRVAQLFHLPPAKLGAKSGDSLTYSTTELQGIEFVTYTLRRWLVRIEKSIQRDPSIFTQGDRFFAEFLADALLRADTKARFEAYKIGVEAGILHPDEARERENLPPRQDLPQPKSSGPES